LLSRPQLSAQDKKPLEFRYTTGAPPKTVWEMQLNRFVEDVDKESGGTMKIIPFINAQLGNEQDTMQQVARGRIDSGGFSLTAAALLAPELAVLSFPFLFSSTAEQDCVLDNHMLKTARDRLAKRGVYMTGWTHVGGTDVIGKKPYIAPVDVKGLKARSAPTKAAATISGRPGRKPESDRHHRMGGGVPERPRRRGRRSHHLLLSFGPGQGGAGHHSHGAPGCARRRGPQQGAL
jgi:TRAP-type C4-dicarboxylate transport system substrate-binding protein